MNELFQKRFSLPHQERPITFHNAIDSGQFDDHMYNIVANASPQFRCEIADIYFGHSFKYDYDGSKVIFGEVMGVEASPKQIENLFRIQNELGVPISLTLNSLGPHLEIVLDIDIRKKFLSYIRWFYDRGLRLCTISHIHLMASGLLQERFPEMKWKNTVNHLVTSAQQVADYAALGFNIIMLDRSLNRNFEELKQVKKVAALKGVKTSLLMTEGCLPSCPFKTEHDSVQADLQRVPQFNYWASMGDLSCKRWRVNGSPPTPRSGTDIVAPTKPILDHLLQHVDIFKFSSRISRPAPGQKVPGLDRYMWELGGTPTTRPLQCESFSDVYKNNLIPFNAWMPAHKPLLGGFLDIKSVLENYPEIVKENALARLWLSEEGSSLAHILSNCKNQCWDCHACERTFGYPDIESLIEIKKPVTSAYFSRVDSYQIKICNYVKMYTEQKLR